MVTLVPSGSVVQSRPWLSRQPSLARGRPSPLTTQGHKWPERYKLFECKGTIPNALNEFHLRQFISAFFIIPISLYKSYENGHNMDQ
jgi:hypothetical protein